MAKQKIAILGGGLGSMTTAFWLTSTPDWQDKYEITVYQVGWRLGGKGTTGRGEDGQIFEHGLHIWIGFYDNAFRMIQAAYKEMNRPAGSPLATWQEAFTPHNYIVIAEKVKDQWKNWPWDFPTNPRVPGDAGEFLTLWDFLYEGLQLLVRHIQTHSESHPELQGDPKTPGHLLTGLFDSIGQRAEVVGVFGVGMLLEGILALAALHRTQANSGEQPDEKLLAGLLDHLQNWLHAQINSDTDDDYLRRFLIVADVGLAMGKGMLTDIVGNEVNGFDEIDQLDFREWLQKYGAADSSVSAAPLEALYDLVFAYENGEVDKPNFGAGAALLSCLRIGLDYKGSIFWKMNAGMGDTIFVPFYTVLKARGVNFEFFSRVENLGLSPDKAVIDSITIGQQVTLKGDYDPFITVQDLPCWPANPNFDQIVEGEQLKAQSINLESFWTPWQNVATKTLQQGVDFDQVVLGISIASFPYICSELIETNPRWKAMCENVGTVRTMSMQWWLKPSLDELGWPLPSPVMDGYVDPMNTWADMSFLLPLESWKGDQKPLQLSYFCGAMVGGIPDRNDPTVPQQALDAVKKVGLDFANQSAGFLFPKATQPGNPAGLDFSNFFGGFDGQYFRANIDPSERYVLSLKGSVTSRMKPGDSGFSNLFLTGDWTYNYFNAGCVEATVIAGMLCSNAITGYPAISQIEGVRPGKWWEQIF